MSAGSTSLLDYLETPIVVGDPDGRAVYLNPAFETHFSVWSDASMGQPLAQLFQGGAREAVLRAVASVCGGSGALRFRMREGDAGYSAQASPIVAGPDRVGVVILFSEELAGDERILAFYRDVQGSLDELSRCLMGVVQRPEVDADENARMLIEDGVRHLERLRKRADDLADLLTGRPQKP